jgi:hypothetical protein
VALSDLLLAQRVAARHTAATALEAAQEAERKAEKDRARAEEAALVAQQRATAVRGAPVDGLTAEQCMMHEADLRAAARDVARTANLLAAASAGHASAKAGVDAARGALAAAHEAVEALRRHGEETAARARSTHERRAADLADDSPRTLKKI